MSVTRRVRRAPRAVVGPQGTVEVSLRVTAEVVGGTVDKKQFAAWLTTAIQDYHRWRVGWVGLAMHCSLKTPEVEVVDEAKDS